MNATYQAGPSVWSDPDFVRDVASGRFECVNLELRAEPSHVLGKIFRKLSIRNLLRHLRPDHCGKACSAHL